MLTILEPHTVLSVAPTGVGKTHLALDLLECAYINFFYFIIILCITLRYYATYRSRKRFWLDPDIITIVPGDHLYDWNEKFDNLLDGFKTLFLIDNIIADETLDK